MIYKNKKTKNISFPLGGIGTGCIGLSGNGEIKDWEIFNKPNKNTRNRYSHFAIKATCANKTIAKILQGDTNESLMGIAGANEYTGFGFGPASCSLAGFPHFKNLTFNGEFPIANLTFSDTDFPATIRLCAFNPFIPHDDFHSSLPAAFFEWEIENTAKETIEFAIAATVCNPAVSTLNQQVSLGKNNGILFASNNVKETDEKYCDLCLLTDSDNFDVQEYWYRGGWLDAPTTYWKNFTSSPRMPKRSYTDPANFDHGTVVTYASIPAGEKKKIRFVIAWNVPNGLDYLDAAKRDEITWKNYYATQFKNSLDSAVYALDNFSNLYNKTLRFSNALQSSTLSKWAKDAISANLSVLKTPTVLRVGSDGAFWGWEGLNSQKGSCFGTCQHVYNYAYALPYLFPKLERSIRENTIHYALLDSGATAFRLKLPFKKVTSVWRSCVDGQMGEVIKCYREWKFSGDNEWLKQHSKSIFKMLEYAWSKDNPDKWDENMDGVIEGRQHHTLDMELFSPNSWLQGFYLLALNCGAEIARAVGDEKRANLYQTLYEKGKAWTNEHLFNGAYFHQKINLKDKTLIDRFEDVGAYWNEECKEIKYQVGEGCIIDQMLADWHAVLIGMNEVFDTEKKKIALENLYKNNFKFTMRDFANMWRNFALNDEQGAVICSYPQGVQTPAIPIPYTEETMTGFEYALAGLMIANGYVTEGESIVKAVRERYDGEKRNPWNEFECGSNYARSMASYALLPIYSGFTFDMPNKHIAFAPVHKKGKYLFSVCETYGTVKFNERGYRLTILGNPLTLCSISIPNGKNVKKVSVDGKNVPFTFFNNNIVFNNVKIEKELYLK